MDSASGIKRRDGSGMTDLHHEAERLFLQILTMEDGPERRDLLAKRAAITSRIEQNLLKLTDSTEPQPAAALHSDLHEISMKRLEAAWKIEYTDPTSNTDRLHRHLTESYENWTKAEGFYAPYFAVFQSSGHGKSRLLKELCTSRQIPHLYICFRPAQSSGYPLRTRDIADFLTRDPSQNKWDAFLRAVLFLFCDVTKHESDSGIAYGMWENYKDTTKSLEAMICTSAENLLESSGIVSLDHLGPSPFLFVIDEARELVTATDKFGLSCFRMLRRGLSTYGMGIFAILMDTLASIANFTPTVENDPSFRDGNPKKLFPPFHLVVNVDMFAKPAETAADVKQQLEPCNLVTKGRILWASTILGRKRADRADEDSSSCTDEQLLSKTTPFEWSRVVLLAAMKLVGGRNEWSIDALSRAASLSVLSARAQVSIAPASDASSVAVGSHLATCVSISENRDSVFSLFPSEPAVAAGAFHVVWAHPDPKLRQKESMNNYAKLLSHLQTSLVQGIVDAGQCGELVARLLLNIAWDLSVGSVEKFYSMISLEDFLNNLIGSERLDRAKKALHDKTILGAQLCFTHFIPISYVPNEQDLIKLMSRGAAAICQRNQVGVDLMIPLLLPGEPDVISVFLISVKNHQSQFDNSWPSSAGSRVSLQTVCPKLLGERHFFTLLMQLGARRSMVFAGQHNNHAALAVFALDTFCPAIDLGHIVRRNLHAILDARQGIEGIGFDEESRNVVPNLVPLHWAAEARPPRHDLSVSAGNISSENRSPTATSGDAFRASFRLLDVVSRTWWTLNGTSKTTTHEVIALFQQRGLAATILRPNGAESQMKRVLQPVALCKCIDKDSEEGTEVIYITINADDIGLVCTFPVSAEPFSAELHYGGPEEPSKELPGCVKDYLTKLVKTEQKRTRGNKRKRDEKSEDNETEAVTAEGTSENLVRTKQRHKQTQRKPASKKIPASTVTSGFGAQDKRRTRQDDKLRAEREDGWKRDEKSEDNETKAVTAEGTSENPVRTRQRQKQTQSKPASKKIPASTVTSKQSGFGAQEKRRTRNDRADG